MPSKPPRTPFYLIDTSHVFYRPLSTRIAIVVGICIWTVVELVARDMFWIVISGALAAYSANVLLIRYIPPAEVRAAPQTDDDDEEGELEERAEPLPPRKEN